MTTPMTSTPSEAPLQSTEPAATENSLSASQGAPAIQPVLEKLFELYPNLFGATFLPLKLGVFQELLAAHPDQFERDTLKLALGQHTRSSPYLQSVAAGLARHDLQGQACDALAPEHVYFALVELFRRRQRRSRVDLRPKLRKQLIAAFEASGLTHQVYLARVQTKDVAANQFLQEALAEHAGQAAKQEATLRAFDGCGKTPEEFADMYGLNPRDVVSAIKQRERQQNLMSPADAVQQPATASTGGEDPT